MPRIHTPILGIMEICKIAYRADLKKFLSVRDLRIEYMRRSVRADDRDSSVRMRGAESD